MPCIAWRFVLKVTGDVGMASYPPKVVVQGREGEVPPLRITREV